MATRVSVSPELYSWAIARSRTSPDALASKFPKLELWMTSPDQMPTLKQLEKLRTQRMPPWAICFWPSHRAKNSR